MSLLVAIGLSNKSCVAEELSFSYGEIKCVDAPLCVDNGAPLKYL
jgi:hypothetical protein